MEAAAESDAKRNKQQENKNEETEAERSANCKATDWKNSCWCRLLVEQENALGSWWKPPAAAAAAAEGE